MAIIVPCFVMKGVGLFPCFLSYSLFSPKLSFMYTKRAYWATDTLRKEWIWPRRQGREVVGQPAEPSPKEIGVRRRGRELHWDSPHLQHSSLQDWRWRNAQWALCYITGTGGVPVNTADWLEHWFLGPGGHPPHRLGTQIKRPKLGHAT